MNNTTHDFNNSFALFYQENEQNVLVKIVKTTKNKEDAEDMKQKVFSLLWEKIRDGRLDDIGNLQSYLFGIMNNLCRSYIKKKNRVKQIKLGVYTDDLEHPQPFHDPLIFEELQDLITTGIDQMPKRRQKIFMLKFNEGKSNEEIAEILKISTDIVKNQYYLANKLLRKLMKAHHI